MTVRVVRVGDTVRVVIEGTITYWSASGLSVYDSAPNWLTWNSVKSVEALERLPLAIDPAGCGCTECITRLYVPLDQATDKQIRQMRDGLIRDNTGTSA